MSRSRWMPYLEAISSLPHSAQTRSTLRAPSLFVAGKESRGSDVPLTPSPSTDTVPRTEMELQSLRQEAEELRKKIKVKGGRMQPRRARPLLLCWLDYLL